MRLVFWAGNLPGRGGGHLRGSSGFAIGTTSGNIGDRALTWQANNNLHRVTAQNLYRWGMLNGSGRVEQLGQSHLKHRFTALGGSVRAPCDNNNTGDTLDPNCSDSYSSV